MAAVVTVNDVLDGHVGLDVECLDRIYLNGYVPNLQVAGQVVSFMTAHLGNPIPSPAIMEKIGTAFRKAVDRFAADNKIAVVRFGKDDRKIEVMRPYLARQARTGRSGVAAIGIAQEFQNVFSSAQRKGDSGVPWFSFFKADRRVTCFYFYLWDVDFGPAFIKICAYFRTRSRCGSTATSGPNARPPGRGSGSPSCPMGLPPVRIPPRCRPSVIGWARAHRGVLRTLDEPAAVAADRARPRRGLLVGVSSAGRGVGADAVAPSEPTEQFGLLRGELLIGDDAALMQPGQRLDGRDDGRGVPGRAGSRLGCLRLRCELRCRL